MRSAGTARMQNDTGASRAGRAHKTTVFQCPVWELALAQSRNEQLLPNCRQESLASLSLAHKGVETLSPCVPLRGGALSLKARNPNYSK